MATTIRSTDQTYFSQVNELLHLEAEAITKAAERLDPASVEEAIKLLSTCKGKVVLSGVGKSGIVARKIAATLMSIGTVAVFLHPSDALHGDLGIIASEDIVIALSNSGETNELIAMLPCIKQRQVPLIVLVGNLSSTLATNADVTLGAMVDREACPLNLAPTTSTTVALAIGDALAITLGQIKGLTPESFALNHPAGRLGKRLTLKVADLMHTGINNPMIPPQASWVEIISGITKGSLGAVNVVDHAGRLLGLITDGDLRRAISKIQMNELEKLKATMIMTPDPVAALPDQLAYDVLQLMENRPSQISVLPVVDLKQRCIGLLRLHDIAGSGLL
jgi:arabinose-5-phosphate isomerase